MSVIIKREIQIRVLNLAICHCQLTLSTGSVKEARLPIVLAAMQYTPETLYHREDALLYIAYVTLIWATHIPADRWHCSLWP